jgi:hypothetical protein
MICLYVTRFGKVDISCVDFSLFLYVVM